MKIELNKENGVYYASFKDTDTVSNIDIIDVAKLIDNLFANTGITETSKMVFDLTNIKYIDSSGLALFLLANKKLEKMVGGVLFINACDAIKNLFKSSSLMEFFRIFDDIQKLNEYLKYL